MKLKTFLFSSAFFLGSSLIAQSYWQQEVNYIINVELDDVKLELRNSSMNFNHNSTDLEGFESRLNLIYSLQKKPHTLRGLYTQTIP